MMDAIGTIHSSRAGWIQKNQEQVTSHKAWHADISDKDSEKLLEGRPSFTYLLRNGEREGQPCYYCSFVKEDGSIKHQFFILEYARDGFWYRNGSTGGGNAPQDIVSKDLHELIPMMMHCDRFASTPLQNA